MAAVLPKRFVATTRSVTITDPLVKYNALVTTGVYQPDLAQHRLAHHLQKLYVRLKDYSPPAEYRARLREVTQAITRAKESESTDELAVESHPIRRNPIFARFFSRIEGKDSLALTRVLTSYEGALEIDSPKGLFLSGEVGTGKSMLLDLLADGLPTSRKRRWHFNTFMLYTFSSLEQFRTSHPSIPGEENEYSLLWFAKKLIDESPILFLDEFQLPDRTSSKILSNLFVIFFQLGGVLVVSSNRMPEELEKATGTYYTPPITGGLFGHFLGIRRAKQLQGEMFGQTSDFAAFLEVLKARCDFWHLEGARDWRRREAEVFLEDKNELFDETLGILEALKSEAGAETSGQTEEQAVALEKPSKFILSAESEPSWNKVIEESVPREAPVASIPWQSGELIVYARAVRVPKQYGRVCYWDFNELVESFGPADYISLASNFHTFIIDRVPVLTLSMKNEARRFITFLDALYEARCKLIIRAEVGPDDLFFPDMRPSSTPTDGKSSPGEVEDSEDATYSETVAEVFQDQVSPFRPNVSTYSESPNSRYPDQDSEFGMEKKVDFVKTGSAFTGEDERFAYKRAASRLWELCSAQWHARTGDWWQPLPAESRHWEGSEASVPLAASPPRPAPTDVTYGPVVELDEPAGLARLRIDFLKKKHQE